MEWVDQYRTQIAWLLGLVCSIGAFFGFGGGDWLSKLKAKSASVIKPSTTGADAREELMGLLVRGQVICRDVLKDQASVDHLAAVQASLMKVPESYVTGVGLPYEKRTTPAGFSSPQG